MVIRIFRKPALVAALIFSCYYTPSSARLDPNLAGRTTDDGSLETHLTRDTHACGADYEVTCQYECEPQQETRDFSGRISTPSKSTTEKIISGVLHTPSAIKNTLRSFVVNLVSMPSRAIHKIRYYFMTHEEKLRAIEEKQREIDIELEQLYRDSMSPTITGQASSSEENISVYDYSGDLNLEADPGTRKEYLKKILEIASVPATESNIKELQDIIELSANPPQTSKDGNLKKKRGVFVTNADKPGEEGAVIYECEGGHIQNIYKFNRFQNKPSKSTARKILSAVLYVPSVIKNTIVSVPAWAVSKVGSYFMTHRKNPMESEENRRREDEALYKIRTCCMRDLANEAARTPEDSSIAEGEEHNREIETYSDKEEFHRHILECLGVEVNEYTIKRIRDIIEEYRDKQRQINLKIDELEAEIFGTDKRSV